MNKFKNTKKIISDSFNQKINFYNNDKYLGLNVNKTEVYSITKFLKDNERLLFDQLIDITAIDYPSRDLRFDIIYIFISLTLNQRIIVKSSVNENDNGAKENETPQSLHYYLEVANQNKPLLITEANAVTITDNNVNPSVNETKNLKESCNGRF